MSAPQTIRPLRAADLPSLQGVIGATGLFPPALLDGMVAGFLDGTAGDAFWLAEDAEAPAGLAYCAAERMTEGCWNLLLIAVHPDRQGQGLGAALVRRVEQVLAGHGARLLLVETSGLPGFAGTWEFYRRTGFTEEARIRDFYAAGEDKLVFRKRLDPAAPPGPA